VRSKGRYGKSPSWLITHSPNAASRWIVCHPCLVRCSLTPGLLSQVPWTLSHCECRLSKGFFPLAPQPMLSAGMSCWRQDGALAHIMAQVRLLNAGDQVFCRCLQSLRTELFQQITNGVHYLLFYFDVLLSLMARRYCMVSPTVPLGSHQHHGPGAWSSTYNQSRIWLPLP